VRGWQKTRAERKVWFFVFLAFLAALREGLAKNSRKVWFFALLAAWREISQKSNIKF
jgi:hypothetical protein